VRHTTYRFYGEEEAKKIRAEVKDPGPKERNYWI
jgi:hypothetical protein